MTRDGMPGLIAQLLERSAGVDDLCRAVTGRSKDISWDDAFGDIAAVAVHPLSWLSDRDQKWVRYTATDAILDALTTNLPEAGADSEALTRVLGKFTTWLASRPDSEVLAFCWRLMCHDRDHNCEGRECMAPVYALHQAGRLTGALDLGDLNLAILLAAEVRNMFWWCDQRRALADWDRDSSPYFQALSHESYVVKLWAAKAIGQMYEKLPQVQSRVLLEHFRDLEATCPGVAGAFLNGADWQDPDSPLADVDSGYMRPWFLDCLQFGPENCVPEVQSLAFYAHEYFAHDADAIRQMIRMGRGDVALQTATEDPGAAGKLWEVMQEMAACDDPAIAVPIRGYLREFDGT